jgi:peptidoglycan/xylan/chitin deacetylase (PgdA/CDA1 family)
VRVDVTSHSDGAATWSFQPRPVAPRASYRYTSWYRSSVPVEMLVVFTTTAGGTAYALLGNAGPSTDWKEFTATFTAPSDAADLRTFQSITAVGWMELDDVSVRPFTPRTFARPLVSLTFDDGYASHVTEALPKLTATGLKGTFYLVSGDLGTAPPPALMTRAQVAELSGNGMQIGGHTLTHPDLTTVSPARLTTELVRSQLDLQGLSGQPVDDFASPFGAYDDAVVSQAMSRYASHRTVDDGHNDRETFDLSHIKAKMVLATTTVDEVKDWLDTARARGTWLVLVFHDILPDPTEYDMTPESFDAVIDAVKDSQIAVATIADARAELAPQAASG